MNQFTISRRNSLKIHKPEINYLFKLDKEKNSYSDINQILKNKFLLGERYRLLGFKFSSEDKPIFFRFNLPRELPNFKRPKNVGWFGPSQIYIPLISNKIEKQKEIEKFL